MNLHDLAAITAYYSNDDRVTRIDGGYKVCDGRREWVVARDNNLYWRAYAQFGDFDRSEPHDTPDEAIHAVIGDPR